MGGWSQWQQGWGDHWGVKNMGSGMFNSGRPGSARMYNNSSNSPRTFGSPYNNNGGSYNNFSGNDFNQMGRFRPGNAQHQQMGGMSGEHWKYNKPGYGSPYGSPRGTTNMPHG